MTSDGTRMPAATVSIGRACSAAAVAFHIDGELWRPRKIRANGTLHAAPPRRAPAGASRVRG